MKKTTFTKKGSNKPTAALPGTQASIHNGLLLTSTGIPSLDALLGGGLPVGSVMLIEEDSTNRFAKIMTKYFLAEGVMCDHGLCLISRNEPPKKMMESLPKAVNADKVSKQAEGDMNIAMRYNNLPKAQKSLSDFSKYGHHYDISKLMDSVTIQECHIDILDLLEIDFEAEEKDIFRYTMKYVKEKTEQSSYTLPSTSSFTADIKLNVLRVTILNLGSPVWCTNEQQDVQRILRFLHCLRALARNTIMVCLVTIPTELFSMAQIKSFRQFSDCALELKSFEGEKKNPLYQQYHGLFKIHKLPCLNSLAPFVPEYLDLAFELKKTKFVIERLDLPPDISETVSRQGIEEGSLEKRATKSSPCGGTTLSKNLDF